MHRAMACVLALAAGCGAQPVEYRSQNEIPSGPGLFSGSDGEFVLRIGAASPAGRDDFERWKKGAEGSDEYREFQDWREWREWRRQQRE